MNQRKRGEQRGECGSTVVEFALIFLFILTLSGGLVDLGLYYFSQHIAQDLARDAARAAAVEPGVDQTWVENYIVTAIPNGLNLVEGYTVTFAQIGDPSDPDAPNPAIEVMINGDKKNFFLGIVGLPTLSLTARAVQRYEA